MPHGPKGQPEDPLKSMRRFAKPARDGRREPDPALCRHLQARIDAREAASRYWCARTMRSEGPDGAPAQPEECTDERACFEAATVEGEG
jgi:hypothetical protein